MRKSVEVLRMERGRGSSTIDLSRGREPETGEVERETGALSGGGGNEGEESSPVAAESPAAERERVSQ